MIVTTMKIFLAFVALLNLALGFQQVVTKPRSALALQMGMFDDLFKPAKNLVVKEEEASQFSVHAAKKRGSNKTGTAEWLGNFFSHPIHGHGSDELSLEDMYETQQNVLAERRKLFGDGHTAMKNKYRNPSVDHLRDIATHDYDPATLNQKEDEAMYVDENDTGFSFPWNKNKFSP